MWYGNEILEEYRNSNKRRFAIRGFVVIGKLHFFIADFEFFSLGFQCRNQICFICFFFVMQLSAPPGPFAKFMISRFEQIICSRRLFQVLCRKTSIRRKIQKKFFTKLNHFDFFWSSAKIKFPPQGLLT